MFIAPRQWPTEPVPDGLRTSFAVLASISRATLTRVVLVTVGAVSTIPAWVLSAHVLLWNTHACQCLPRAPEYWCNLCSVVQAIFPLGFVVYYMILSILKPFMITVTWRSSISKHQNNLTFGSGWSMHSCILTSSANKTRRNLWHLWILSR